MFNLVSKYSPSGDQPEAIRKLVEGVKNNKKNQVLLGATGTGKTFTIANVIKETGKKTLVLAHNKTLAGQLYSELKELFPNNHVEYFVSYYDYYQPEAYVASTDTYIEKDSSINEEIDELRHSATSSLLSYDDVIVVASVSCIYGIGEVEEYKNHMLTLSQGMKISRDDVLKKLVDMLFERNDFDFKRATFRVRGDTVDIIPASEFQTAIRVEFFGDEIDRISEIDVVTGVIKGDKKNVSIFPASHFVTSHEKILKAEKEIKKDLAISLENFKNKNKFLEEQRLRERTNYDLEMLKETGMCSGIENYSRYFDGREPGVAPTTLLDFFGDDFLLVVDESHVTLPQVRGMYNGDRARNNRPLRFEEFTSKIKQAIYVSATPGDYELELVDNKVIEQIIRPTGLLDPIIEVRKTENQIFDLVNEIRDRIVKNEKVLITTLTIKMSEELTEYLRSLDIKVAYLHSEVKTLERLQIIHDLRSGKYDCIVGINLLREGIDIPEVSLIAILDADKEGFLRSNRSLIQIIGRCARNANGKCIMYADKITNSMEYAINETKRRRTIQEEYNKVHGIVPKTIEKSIKEVITNVSVNNSSKNKKKSLTEENLNIEELEKEMKKAAKELDFERAMQLRDIIFEFKLR